MALAEAHGRVLAEDLEASRDQPPFAASAMDGYAVRVAGHRHPAGVAQDDRQGSGRPPLRGAVGPGEAVRIFTGAPVPEGADTIVIQENAAEAGDVVTVAAERRRGRISGMPDSIFAAARWCCRRPACSARAPSGWQRR